MAWLNRSIATSHKPSLLVPHSSLSVQMSRLIFIFLLGGNYLLLLLVAVPEVPHLLQLLLHSPFHYSFPLFLVDIPNLFDADNSYLLNRLFARSTLVKIEQVLRIFHPRGEEAIGFLI